MVEFLLENGARINYIGGYYQLRARRKEVCVLKYNDTLKKIYVNPMYKSNSQRIGAGLNAMHIACIQGKADIVQLLIQHAENKVLTAVLNAKSKVSDSYVHVRGYH